MLAHLFQIANLKAVLLRKDAESVRSHQSGSSSPERNRGKADGPSLLCSNQGDIANIEVKNLHFAICTSVFLLF